MDGGAGNDTLYGGDGNDTISGGANNDDLYSGGGNNTLNGDAGDDNFYCDNYASDVVDGGDGVDTAWAWDRMLDSFPRVEYFGDGA